MSFKAVGQMWAQLMYKMNTVQNKENSLYYFHCDIMNYIQIDWIKNKQNKAYKNFGNTDAGMLPVARFDMAKTSAK